MEKIIITIGLILLFLYPIRIFVGLFVIKQSIIHKIVTLIEFIFIILTLSILIINYYQL